MFATSRCIVLHLSTTRDMCAKVSPICKHGDATAQQPNQKQPMIVGPHLFFPQEIHLCPWFQGEKKAKKIDTQKACMALHRLFLIPFVPCHCLLYTALATFRVPETPLCRTCPPPHGPKTAPDPPGSPFRTQRPEKHVRFKCADSSHCRLFHPKTVWWICSFIADNTNSFLAILFRCRQSDALLNLCAGIPPQVNTQGKEAKATE